MHLCGFMCRDMAAGVPECLAVHILPDVRENQCTVASFSLSNYQASFAHSPHHHHLVLFHSSPMDCTQLDLQLLQWPDAMCLMNNQEPGIHYKVGDKAELLY